MEEPNLKLGNVAVCQTHAQKGRVIAIRTTNAWEIWYVAADIAVDKGFMMVQNAA